MDPTQWDAFICHRGPDAKQNFASFLHYALDVQGISAFFDHKMVGGTNPTAAMESAMQTASWGVIILSPNFFESKWCMTELGVFLDRGNVLPVALGLEVDDIDAAKIAGRKGGVWGVHGGELWKKCEMEEAAWRSLVDRVPKEVVVVKSEDSNPYWGELINELVINLAKKLGRLVVESRVARSTVTPPYLQNLEFLGRDKELEELHKSLLKSRSRVSISSMGGMGKTQLALEYIYRHLGEYWKVLWVNAGSNSLLTNYLGLAKDLGVSLEKEKGGEATKGGGQWDKEVALIRGALERLRVPCLLIFDDVSDERQFSHLLPKLSECRVLVTTRVNLVNNFHNIHLKQLAPVDGLSLIRGSPHPGPPEFEEDLQRLAERFDYLTLALSVCSAWLRRSRLEPAALLQRLDKKEVAFAFKGREADPIFKKNPDLVALFQASIEQIKGTHMGTLGERIVWVGGWFAGVAIRCELIASAAAHLGPLDGEVDDAVDVLVDFNLANRASAEGLQGGGHAGGLVFHSIVRSFGRVQGGLEPAVAMVKALVEKGDVAVDTEHFQHACDLPIPPKANPRVLLDAADTEGAVNRILLPLVSHYNRKGWYLKACDTISGANIDGMPYEVQWRYYHMWAWNLNDCGRYAQALPLYERALHMQEKALGPEHPEVATTLNDMAGLQYNQGQYEEALPIYKRALRISEKVLGKEHAEVASTLNDMARVLKSQGKYDEALLHYRRALRVREKALGPDHPMVATTLNNMADLFQSQGKYEEALPLYKRALCVQEKALGPEHPNVATTLNNLAGLLRSQGKYEEASQHYERALPISEKTLGPDHPLVATELNNMAGLLESQGKYEEARPLYKRSLVMLEKALGPEHPSVATTLHNMAGLLGRMGQYDEALQLFERALRIKEKALGPEHPSKSTTLNNMGQLLQRQGKHVEALQLYKRGLRMLEKSLGPEHPDLATTLNNMASLSESQGNYHNALLLYERALRISEKALGSEHPNVATTLNGIAGIYHSQGEYKEALPPYERALCISEKALGLEHPEVATVLNNMAELLRSQGEYEKALLLSQRALRIREKALEPGHPDVAMSLNNTALVLHSQGKKQKALPLYVRALHILEKALGLEHPEVATTLDNMAKLLESPREALSLYERALSIQKKALGPAHPVVATTLNNMAELLRSQEKYEEALPLYERSLRISEKALGPEHPDVATTLNNMAGLLRSQGKYEEALPLYKRSLGIFEKALGPEHPSVLTVLQNLMIAMAGDERREEALERGGVNHPAVEVGLNGEGTGPASQDSRRPTIRTQIPADGHCGLCKKKGSLLRCSRCKSILYCNIECQKGHWVVHKVNCKKSA